MKTQTQIIEKHLLKGRSITAKQAFKMCGTMRLSDIIYRLRRKHNIGTVLCKEKGMLGQVVEFAKYKII